MNKILLFTLGGLFLVVSVTGCNMFRGAGKDISNAGSSIQSVGR